MPESVSGLPQPMRRVIPIRSPCWTLTDGESETLFEEVVLNGPRSAIIVNVSPERRKNLIFAALRQLADHPNVAVSTVPVALAGDKRSMSVWTVEMTASLEFGETALPIVSDTADALGS